MAPSLCEQALPELRAPWSNLSTTIRCCWRSAHPKIEIRSVTISGAKVFDKHVSISSGEEIRIDDALVPYGCTVSWAVVLFVGDVTSAAVEGLTICAEFRDAKGRGIRDTICAERKAAANQAVQLSGTVEAPEQDHD